MPAGIVTCFPTSLVNERNKKCQAKNGQAKKNKKKTRVLTQQRSFTL